MRVWHSPWSWLKEIDPLDSVAGNTLIGMFTRLIFRKPFHVARAAIVVLIGISQFGLHSGLWDAPMLHPVRRARRGRDRSRRSGSRARRFSPGASDGPHRSV